MIKQKYQGNILLFYLLSIFSALAFIYDLILVIYYQSFGLTFSQISFVAVVVGVFVLIFEVPSGAYADLYGKKKSLLIGSLAFLVSFVIIVSSSSLVPFLIAGAILGISLAFNSGSYTALLYDSLKAAGREKDYLKVNSRIEAIFLATTILTAFFGPYLYSFNKFIPLYITVVFAFLSLFIVLLLFDPARTKKHSKFAKRHLKQIREGFAYSIKHSKIIWLIVFMSLFVVIERTLANVLEVPYLLDLGFVMKQVAVISVIGLLVQILFAWKTSSIEKTLGENGSFLFVILLTSIPLFLTRFFGIYSIGILIGIFWGGMQFLGLISNNYMTHHLRKKNRATVLSISSMFSALAVIILLPFVGWVIDSNSTIYSVGILSLAGLVGGLILYGIKRGKGY